MTYRARLFENSPPPPAGPSHLGPTPYAPAKIHDGSTVYFRDSDPALRSYYLCRRHRGREILRDSHQASSLER